MQSGLENIQAPQISPKNFSELSSAIAKGLQTDTVELRLAT